MPGRRTAPLSMADVDAGWKRIPPTSRGTQIRAWREAHGPDDAFATWYATAAVPPGSPSYLVTLLPLQLMSGWSDREAVENAFFEARVPYALGVRRTFEITWDHSTRCKFPAKARSH